MKVTFVGAGNLATRLSLAMRQTGLYEFMQVYSQTEAHACLLAEALGCGYTTEADSVQAGADLYIFSLKDTALEPIIARIPANDGLWVHTAGSMPMAIFQPYIKRYGVLYPLQTFSRQRQVDFRPIPFFLETAHAADGEILSGVAASLSDNVRFLSSEKRKKIHLAAVFACNFTNHIYALAEKIVSESGVPFDVLLPLIDETAAKIHVLSPREAQTGPAIRYDENVIGKHLAMLEDNPQMKEIYRLLSQSIHQEAIKTIK